MKRLHFRHYLLISVVLLFITALIIFYSQWDANNYLVKVFGGNRLYGVILEYKDKNDFVIKKEIADLGGFNEFYLNGKDITIKVIQQKEEKEPRRSRLLSMPISFQQSKKKTFIKTDLDKIPRIKITPYKELTTYEKAKIYAQGIYQSSLKKLSEVKIIKENSLRLEIWQNHKVIYEERLNNQGNIEFKIN